VRGPPIESHEWLMKNMERPGLIRHGGDIVQFRLFHTGNNGENSSAGGVVKRKGLRGC